MHIDQSQFQKRNMATAKSNLSQNFTLRMNILLAVNGHDNGEAGL